MEFYWNQTGLAQDGARAVIAKAAASEVEPGQSCVWQLEASSPAGEAANAGSGRTQPFERVDNWAGGALFARIDLSSVPMQPGQVYALQLSSGGRSWRVGEISLAPGDNRTTLLNNLIFYFRGQRHTGAAWKADALARFVDRPERVNVAGGWNDASADWSSNLSHLNYAAYMNPQQAPLPVWTLLESAELLEGGPDFAGRAFYLEKLREEAAWGADKLVRMLDPQGYFYLNAGYSRVSRESTILENTYLFRERKSTYQAGLRQGGGMAIAALARAARQSQGHDLEPREYLAAAKTAFAHLREHNTQYLDDGVENIIDDYCGLLAALELWLVDPDPEFRAAAEERVENLVARIMPESDEHPGGWFRADDAGERPFYHPSDEALPLMALRRFLQVLPDAPRAEQARAAIVANLKFHSQIGLEMPNPFRYPRMLMRAAGSRHETASPEERAFSGPIRTSFFMPHRNETGYWWQGENARISGLSAAFTLALRDQEIAAGLNPAEEKTLRELAQGSIDWILGANPFSCCMLHGTGRRNQEYLAEVPNAPGGICNGVTASPETLGDLAFCSGKHAEDPKVTWRWAEQWIPHAAWFLPAIVAGEPVKG